VRIPSVDWLVLYMRSIGLVIAGAIIGGALFMAVYSHNFSLLYMEKERLVAENIDMRKTLEPLLQNKDKRATVSQFKLNLFSAPRTEPLSELAVMQLKRLLTNDLETLRGLSIDGIDDSLLVARQIIRRKVYEIDKDQEYRVDVVLVMIRTSELALWMEVRPHIRSD
jgi:hypothetical protein